MVRVLNKRSVNDGGNVVNDSQISSIECWIHLIAVMQFAKQGWVVESLIKLTRGEREF